MSPFHRNVAGNVESSLVRAIRFLTQGRRSLRAFDIDIAVINFDLADLTSRRHLRSKRHNVTVDKTRKLRRYIL